MMRRKRSHSDGVERKEDCVRFGGVLTAAAERQAGGGHLICCNQDEFHILV